MEAISGCTRRGRQDTLIRKLRNEVASSLDPAEDSLFTSPVVFKISTESTRNGEILSPSDLSTVEEMRHPTPDAHTLRHTCALKKTVQSAWSCSADANHMDVGDSPRKNYEQR